MYNEFFNFSETPFSLTPDTSFFLNEQSHRDALNTMLLALKHCEGFIKVVGEVGTGKTLLGRILLSRLSAGFKTIYIPNPYMTPEELKFYVAKELGADIDSGMASHEILACIYRKLVQFSRHDKQVVLIVDEAQAMPRDTVESLRLLSNMETEKRKLIQIVLLGQPELDDLLNRQDLRQLKQRIVFSEYLKPFHTKAVERYVAHRVSAARHSAIACFSRSAVKMIARASGGTPRLINILCHKALICAYGRGNKIAGLWHVLQAVRDTPESRTALRSISSILLWLTPSPKLEVVR
jgi:MSHA biogenesis protein MshM